MKLQFTKFITHFEKKNEQKSEMCGRERSLLCYWELPPRLSVMTWKLRERERERERLRECVYFRRQKKLLLLQRERESERSVAVVRYKRSVRVRVRLSGTEIQFKLTNSKWEISFVISAILFAASTLFVSSYFYLSLSLPFFVFNFQYSF